MPGFAKNVPNKGKGRCKEGQKLWRGNAVLAYAVKPISDSPQEDSTRSETSPAPPGSVPRDGHLQRQTDSQEDWRPLACGDSQRTAQVRRGRMAGRNAATLSMLRVNMGPWHRFTRSVP